MAAVAKYIAFLRAINVGSHTVKMEHLRRLFEAMRFSNVETFIASGNVIFEAVDQDKKALEQKIEVALHEALGYKVATFIRSPAEVANIARYQPFKAVELEAEGNMLYIGFLADTPDGEAQQKLLAFTTPVDEFHIHGSELYWLCRKKISESTFSGGRLEKILGMPATLRNSTTVKKIASKYA